MSTMASALEIGSISGAEAGLNGLVFKKGETVKEDPIDIIEGALYPLEAFFNLTTLEDRKGFTTVGQVLLEHAREELRKLFKDISANLGDIRLETAHANNSHGLAVGTLLRVLLTPKKEA